MINLTRHEKRSLRKDLFFWIDAFLVPGFVPLVIKHLEKVCFCLSIFKKQTVPRKSRQYHVKERKKLPGYRNETSLITHFSTSHNNKRNLSLLVTVNLAKGISLPSRNRRDGNLSVVCAQKIANEDTCVSAQLQHIQ